MNWSQVNFPSLGALGREFTPSSCDILPMSFASIKPENEIEKSANISSFLIKIESQ